MTKLVELKNATIKAGERVVLPKVSLTLNPTQCLIVEGKNGSGKTLLLETLAGLRQLAGFQAPAVTFCGDNKWGMKLRLTVAENLAFYAALEQGSKKRISSEEISRAASYFALEPNAIVGRLSLGQRQRLCLARLLLSLQPLWLLDEPSANLDHLGEEKLFRLIASHRKNGGAVIMTRHRGRTPPKSQVLRLE